MGRSLEDVFGVSVPSSILYRFKGSVAEYFGERHKTTLERLINCAILHVDETPVRTTKGKGYVWVFAGMEDVFFMYRPSREAGFLKDVLGKVFRRIDFGLLQRLRLVGVRETEMPNSPDTGSECGLAEASI